MLPAVVDPDLLWDKPSTHLVATEYMGDCLAQRRVRVAGFLEHAFDVMLIGYLLQDVAMVAGFLQGGKRGDRGGGERQWSCWRYIIGMVGRWRGRLALWTNDG